MTLSKNLAVESPMRAAVRFPVRLTVHLRAADESFWATTEDISANGLLFSGDRLPQVNSVIEFTLNMPSEVMGSPTDVEVHCLGRVVRHERQGNMEQAAAVIDEYYMKA